MSPTMAAKVLAHFQQATASAAPNAAAMDEAVQEQVESPLTAREREVVQLIAQGARDRDIAERLILTEHTVKKHVKSILRKLGARNRAEAAARLRRPWL
jgi:DNA-binding NarL/FixJ family response regulator